MSFFVDDPQVQSVADCQITVSHNQIGFSYSLFWFEGFLWGSIHLLREEVDHYSFQFKHDGQY